MNQDKLFAEERRKLETEEFEAMIGFVNSKLDTIFESCGIVCQKMIETNVCGIIYCWTFESVNPRTPTQRVRIREALERMTEQLPDAGFAPHISHISFPGAGVRLVHLEIYPREFDSIKARSRKFAAAQSNVLTVPMLGGSTNMLFLLRNTGRYEYNL